MGERLGSKKALGWVGDNAVTLVFVAFTIFGFMASDLSVGWFMGELMGRLYRNAFLVISLIIPVVAGLGVDLVHFGLICIVNIMIGGLTPPFGSMMFTCCSITGCDLVEFVKECIPFIIALLIALLIVTYMPGVTMFIPNLVYPT